MIAPIATSQNRAVQIVPARRVVHTGRCVARYAALTAAVFFVAGGVGTERGLAQGRESLAAGKIYVGPGKVRFSQTRGGQWGDVVPQWHGGRSLIATGGFAVYAKDETGRVVELARTGDRMSPSFLAGEAVKYYEGTPRGFRAPSLDPDDDHDGTADEDRLDGIDNDDDGAIDEDFAAIGDEMVVLGYAARGESPRYVLEFHQETYAWSLPTIDEAVMIGLAVRNAGTSALTDIRIVTYFEKSGPFDVLEGAIPAAGNAPARSVLAVEPGGGTVALVAFPLDTRGAWLAGIAEPPQRLGESVREILAAWDARATGPEESTYMEEHATQVGEAASLFCVSPAIQRLAPGQEARVDVAIVTAQQHEDIADATTNAFETYVGDGANHFIPPPMSLKPRVLWGTYHTDPADGATVVTIEDWNEDAVTAEDISYFSGAERPTARTRRQPSGEIELVLDGGIADDLTGRRATLKGRLATGEFFELNLRPDTDVGVSGPHEVEAFWKTPGKLSSDLLHGSPTPFRNSTSIFYEVPTLIEQEDGTVLRSTGPYGTSVKIYNVSGRLVDVLVEGNMFPGTYSIDWSATDDHGNAVASGVYYVKLQVEKRSITKRLILLK